MNLHQLNVNWSGSHIETSQALLELSKVLSNSAPAFLGTPASTSSFGAAFKMLQDVRCGVIEFQNRGNLCAGLQEAMRAAETSLLLCQRYSVVFSH